MLDQVCALAHRPVPSGAKGAPSRRLADERAATRALLTVSVEAPKVPASDAGAVLNESLRTARSSSRNTRPRSEPQRSFPWPRSQPHSSNIASG